MRRGGGAGPGAEGGGLGFFSLLLWFVRLWCCNTADPERLHLDVGLRVPVFLRECGACQCSTVPGGHSFWGAALTGRRRSE